jgi:hypothetical protein
LGLGGFGEAARFFFWRTRLDGLSGTLLDRKESSKASLEKLGSFRALRSCDLGSVTQNSVLTAISAAVTLDNHSRKRGLQYTY